MLQRYIPSYFFGQPWITFRKLSVMQQVGAS